MQGRLASLALAAIFVLALALSGAVRAETRSALSADARAVTLFPGERVVLRLATDGGLTLVSAAAVDPAAALPPKPGPKPNDAPLQTADPDTLALTLATGDAQTMLRLDSGLSLAFDYRVVLQAERGGRTVAEAASACTVLPLLASFEIWPYAVASVTLSKFVTRTTNAVVCSDPPQMENTGRWPSTPTPASN